MVHLYYFLLASLAVLVAPAYASPDNDFPQSGNSYGGKVRSGPGMNFRQVGSLHEGDPIVILKGTGAMMNGYEWFEIRYRNGRGGYQWGGIMCSSKPHKAIFRTCDGPRLKTNRPTETSKVNGFSVVKVMHSAGSFTHIGNSQWQEADAKGQINFHFQEESRDEWSVYLFDASRNVAIQLDLHRKQVLYGVGTEPKMQLYQISRTFAPKAKGKAKSIGVQRRPQDSTTVHYTCAEGLPLIVTYVNSGNGHAIFSIDGSPEERLEQVVSGSGSQYTNGRFSLFGKGTSATLQSPSGVDNCFEQ